MARRRPRINGVIDKKDLAEIFARAERVVRQQAQAGTPAGKGDGKPSARLGKALIKELLTHAVLVQEAKAAAAEPAPPAAAKPEPTESPKPTAKPEPKPPKAKRGPPKAPETSEPTPAPADAKRRILEPLRPQVRREKVLSLLEYLETREQAEEEPAIATSAAAPTAKSTPKTEPKPKAKSEPTPKTEPTPKLKPEPKTKPKTERKAKPKTEPKVKPKPKPKPKTEPKATPKPKTAPKVKPAERTVSAPKPAPAAEPQPIAQDPVPASTPEPEPIAPRAFVGTDVDVTSSNMFDFELPDLDPTRELRSLQDTQEFLSLTDLTSSLSRAARSHIDDQAAQRTMLEDLEMPVPLSEDPEALEHLERVTKASEISFEGYLEDIERLLVETYEHYKNIPSAFETQELAPGETDLLGPGGRTLESRRSQRASERIQTARDEFALEPPTAPARPAPSVRSAPQPHARGAWPKLTPPPEPYPTRPSAGPTALHDPFSPGPFNPTFTPMPAPSPHDPGAPEPLDPFAVDPYTGQPVTADPFALDPFNPFAATTGNPPPAPETPAASPPAPAAWPTPVGPAAGPPPSYRPIAEPEDPYAWPQRPPPGVLDAQRRLQQPQPTHQEPPPPQPPRESGTRALDDAKRRAEADAARFDPFAGPGADVQTNPFGPGNMFGSNPALANPNAQVPPTRSGGRPIYLQDSEELSPRDQQRLLDADATKRAFANALHVAGLHGMLEYQRPTPGQGSSHRLVLIYDTSRRIFKAPLAPRLSVGDRFQLQDGQVFRVDRCRVFDVSGTPCYQEAQCTSLGRMNMPLRDSWDGT